MAVFLFNRIYLTFVKKLKMKRILAFVGSNSQHSINKKFVQFVASQIEAEVDYMDLAEFNPPLYNIDDEESDGIPQSTQDLNKKLSEYDSLIISANEHNGASSAFFKNHIDWLSRNDRNFLKDKKLFLLSTSPGRGGAKMSLSYLVEVLPRFGAEVVSHFSLASFGHSFSEAKGITDEEQKKEFDLAVMKFQNKI
jgi:NAD(P)H-dependent FMN reductase